MSSGGEHSYGCSVHLGEPCDCSAGDVEAGGDDDLNENWGFIPVRSPRVPPPEVFGPSTPMPKPPEGFERVEEKAPQFRKPFFMGKPRYCSFCAKSDVQSLESACRACSAEWSRIHAVYMDAIREYPSFREVSLADFIERMWWAFKPIYAVYVDAVETFPDLTGESVGGLVVRMWEKLRGSS